MSYSPHSDADRRAMLGAIGVSSVEELFSDVPSHLRFPELHLPKPLSEPELLSEMRGLSEGNVNLENAVCFLGAGAYRHFVPSYVSQLAGRSEFLTAYTPYQAEISQGTLQAIFEYQSLICALTGMDVANASHYDGATSLAEAAIMAVNVARGKRTKVVVAPTVHPEYRETLRTYTQGLGYEVVGDEDLRTSLSALVSMVDSRTACLMLQTPDFLGALDDLSGVADAVHAAGALLVVSADPISLGLFRSPRELGADIAVGEGQALGNDINFGGPYLGYFACLKEHVHKMAGRLVGQTVDTEGRRGFVLTLSAREQHVRRERATSNICSNQALNALCAALYLAGLGKCGLRRVAEICYHRAHYAASKIGKLKRFKVTSTKPFFKEFVVKCPRDVTELNEELLGYGIVGGYDLGRLDASLRKHMLVCVTEMVTPEEIDFLLQSLQDVVL